MIARLAAWLTGRGVTERFARPLAWAIVLVPLLLLARCAGEHWVAQHDKAVVAADRGAADAKVLTETVTADRAAAAAKAKRDRAFADEQTKLEEKIDAAAGNGASPLDAVLDGLR